MLLFCSKGLWCRRRGRSELRHEFTSRTWHTWQITNYFSMHEWQLPNCRADYILKICYKVQNAFQKKNTINTKNKKFMGLTSEHWPPIIVQRACLPDQTWGTIRHPLAKDLTKDNLTIKNTTDQNLQYNSSRNQNC